MQTILQKVSARTVYRSLTRLHDLWIVLAWGGILTGIFLNTFYNRSCYEFTTQLVSTATCQSVIDWVLVFLAAVGGAAAIRDERFAVVGFLGAHLTATVLFVVVLQTPSLFGLTDPYVFDQIISQSIIIALLSQFPIALFFSLIGSVSGIFLGGKLRDDTVQ
jgi:hypothetical protein